MAINDLIEDLSDGVLLINLMEILTNEKVETYHITRPRNRLQQLSNVTLALAAIERWGITLVSFRPENLVDKNSKMTLALLWRIISKFHIQQFLSEDDLEPEIPDEYTTQRRDIYKTTRGSSGAAMANYMKTPREALLRWCRRELEPYATNPITNFGKCFQNAHVFYYLIHRQASAHVDLDELMRMDDEAGLKQAFEVAERVLNIPQTLPPASIADAGAVDESCTMIYIAYFLNHQRSAQGVAPLVGTATRGHNRSSSTGSNTSNSSVGTVSTTVSSTASSPAPLNTSDNKIFFKRPPLKRQDTLTQTPEKANPFSTTPMGSPLDASTTAANNKQAPIPTSPNYNNVVGEASTITSADKLSFAEILSNFTSELRRITSEHEDMLNKTAAKLDERVNRLGDKLDSLEIKITQIRTVVVSATAATPEEESEDNTAHVRERKKSSANGIAPGARRETKEERDERRDKRRSRRKEREDRKRTIESSVASTLTQSSSSCSLVDDAQVDREDIRKITKVQAIVRGHLARRAYKRVKNRRDVALEMLNTEKTYIHNLQILLHEYLLPLRKMSESSSLNADNMKMLYNNIEVILNINNTLLKRLQERMSVPWHFNTPFGDIFFKMSDLLKCYIAYVNHYSRSLNAINDFTKHSVLNEFIMSTSQRTGLQLRDLIIIPVQRIPRYVLLLEEMVKVTDASHPDRAQLVGSLSKMQNIADHVNEKRRDFENVTHVSMLQDAIVGFNILDYASLRYMMEGDLSFHMPSSGSGFGTTIAGVVSSAVTGNPSASDLKGITIATTLHVFLFNQMLVVCKYKKGKDSYFSNKHLFSTSSERKSKQPKYKYIFNHNLTSDTKLSSNKGECWFGVDNQNEYKRFIAKTVAEKDMWIMHIQQAITKATENKKSKNQ
eukprot:gene14561-17208_t